MQKKTSAYRYTPIISHCTYPYGYMNIEYIPSTLTSPIRSRIHAISQYFTTVESLCRSIIIRRQYRKYCTNASSIKTN